MRRHFTATGFVVQGDRTLLLWHKRLQQWMPPGGHIEPDEDPVTAVLREIREETGLAAEVIPLAPVMPIEHPSQLPAPYIILLEDSPEPGDPHQHIDLIYFCRPVDGVRQDPSLDPTLCWVEEAALRAGQPLELSVGGIAPPIALDVRLLGLKAIETARQVSGSRP